MRHGEVWWGAVGCGTVRWGGVVWGGVGWGGVWRDVLRCAAVCHSVLRSLVARHSAVYRKLRYSAVQRSAAGVAVGASASAAATPPAGPRGRFLRLGLWVLASALGSGPLEL